MNLLTAHQALPNPQQEMGAGLSCFRLGLEVEQT